MVDDLDAVQQELREARDEVQAVLMAAGMWVQMRADEDPMAEHLAGRLLGAFDRLTAANTWAATTVHDGGATGG